MKLIPLEGRKTGPVVAVRQVSEADEEVILISKEGQVVRTRLDGIATRKDGSAQGVRVMTLREGDKVAGIAAFRAGLAKRDGAGENGGAEGEQLRLPVAAAPKAARASATKGGKVAAASAKKVPATKPTAKPAAKSAAKPTAKTPKNPATATKSAKGSKAAKAAKPAKRRGSGR